MKEMRHILITGGAGYLGTALAGALLRRGIFVTVADKLLHGGEHLLPYTYEDKFFFSKVDVATSGAVDDVVNQAMQQGAPILDSVVHLAAIVGFPACKNAGESETWRSNVESVQHVFESAENLGVERFLFSSTYSVYGLAPDGKPVTEESELHPQSLYGETKIAAEKYLQTMSKDSDCAPLIFRFATVFGPSPRMRFDLIINQFVLDAFSKGELVIFQRDYSRSFVHIFDVIDGILIGLEAQPNAFRGEIFNLGSEQGNYTKEEIVQLICHMLPDTEVRYEDLSFSGDMRDVRVSFEKIQEKLGFRTKRSVEQGMQDVLRILRSGVIQDPFSDRYRNARLEIQ